MSEITSVFQIYANCRWHVSILLQFTFPQCSSMSLLRRNFYFHLNFPHYTWSYTWSRWRRPYLILWNKFGSVRIRNSFNPEQFHNIKIINLYEVLTFLWTLNCSQLLLLGHIFSRTRPEGPRERSVLIFFRYLDTFVSVFAKLRLCKH